MITNFVNTISKLNIRQLSSLRKITKTEEWYEKKNDFYKMGITEKAIGQLGELVYLEFQYQKGDKISKDDELAIIESVKATDSVKAPFDCELIENNIMLEDSLDSINNDPDKTWIVKVK